MPTKVGNYKYENSRQGNAVIPATLPAFAEVSRSVGRGSPKATPRYWRGGRVARNDNNGFVRIALVLVFFSSLFTLPTSRLFAASVWTETSDTDFADGLVSSVTIVGSGSAAYVQISSAQVTGGTITYSGGYTIHTFTTSGTFTSNGVGTVEVYAWGGGGAGGTINVADWCYGSAGGAGGAAYGRINVVSSSSYVVGVGGAGQVHSTVGAVGGGGPASNNGTDNRFSGGGGGFSGLFITSVSQANAIIIAGGGGGGGSSRAGTGNTGGGGGGTVGQIGASPYDGKTAYGGNPGTQSAAGANASCDGANTPGGQGALQGGVVRLNSYGGGGGGGYWGGSAGGYSESNTMAGGGGGSGYYNPTYVTLATLTAGSGVTPGDSENPLRGSAGTGGAVANPGGSGIVIVRYLSLTTGTYKSNVIDTASKVVVSSISWNPVSQPAGTNIAVGIRVSSHPFSINSSTPAWITVSNGQTLNWQGRYIQYQSTFTTTSSTTTPRLEDISVTYRVKPWQEKIVTRTPPNSLGFGGGESWDWQVPVKSGAALTVTAYIRYNTEYGGSATKPKLTLSGVGISPTSISATGAAQDAWELLTISPGTPSQNATFTLRAEGFSTNAGARFYVDDIVVGQ